MDKNKTVTEEKSVEELKHEIALLESQGTKGGLAVVVLFYGVLGLGGLAFSLYKDAQLLRANAARDEKEKSDAEARLAKRTPEEKLLDALVGAQKSKAELMEAASQAIKARDVEAARTKAVDAILDAFKTGKDISSPESWGEKVRGPKAV